MGGLFGIPVSSDGRLATWNSQIQRLQLHKDYNMSSVDVLQNTLANIPKLSTDDLHTLMNAIKCELPVRENNLAELVDYIPDFCPDTALLDEVLKECASLNLCDSRKKAATQWLSPTGESYTYPDTVPTHKAMDISTFPAIIKLQSLINTSSEVGGPLEACLIIRYNSVETALSLHADDEDIMDHSKPICSFTIGASRSVDFFSKARKPKHVKSVKTSNNGLLIMRPGTQDKMKHCVRAEKPLQDTSASSVRYALSFRALARCQPCSPESPVIAGTALLPKDSSTPQSPPAENCETSPKPTHRRICLVAGDSFAQRLDAHKLGKNRCTVVNIAKGGSKIKAVINQLTDFFSSNPDVTVDKLIVSVGTNDLRNCRKGIDHLKGPLKDLCNTIGKLAPNTKVFFQSLIPLPIRGNYDWETNAVICDFNEILYSSCCYFRYYYIDAYRPFSLPRRRGVPDTRIENLFESGYGIHPRKGRGLGTLARLYIRALHSRFFDPGVFQ